jgi:hypothetical protein
LKPESTLPMEVDDDLKSRTNMSTNSSAKGKSKAKSVAVMNHENENEGPIAKKIKGKDVNVTTASPSKSSSSSSSSDPSKIVQRKKELLLKKTLRLKLANGCISDSDLPQIDIGGIGSPYPTLTLAF